VTAGLGAADGPAAIDGPWVGSARRLPLRGAAEVAVLVWIYVVYAALRNLATGTPARAARHAASILHVERTLGIGIGQAVRDATHDIGWMVSLGNLVYASHAVVPVLVLVLLYHSAPERYRRSRDAFLLVLGIGLLGFWLYPVMPPRILATSYHFVDTAQRLSIGRAPLPGVHVPDPSGLGVFDFSNPYASMPSLHVAWAVFASIAAWPLARWWWARAVLVAYPVLMVVAVTVTWNHWTLDSVAGAATAMVAWFGAGVVARARSRPAPGPGASLTPRPVRRAANRAPAGPRTHRPRGPLGAPAATRGMVGSARPG
jgi:membrane-associated phospholipid phosphatase